MREHRRATVLTPDQRRKDIARSYAHVYLSRGKITREPCRCCSSAEAQMHHPDYNRPLEVEWLCRPCHLNIHKGRACLHLRLVR